MSIQDGYQEIFLAESSEYLNIMSQCLVKLEQNPSDSESLNEIFRAIHTLKGMSATMGFDKLTQLSHKIEDLLDGLRNKRIKVNSDIVDLLFACLDILEALIQDVKLKKDSGIDINFCLKKVQNFLKDKEQTEDFHEVGLDSLEIGDYERKIFEQKEANGYSIFKIRFELVKDCAMKQVRAFLVITNLERIGQILKSIPSIENLKQGQFGYSFLIILASKEKASNIRQDLLVISEVENIEIKPVEIIDGGKTSSSSVQATDMKKIQSMRIPVERLDKIMNLIGELSIAKIRLVQLVQSKGIKPLEDVTFAVDHLTTALQDEVMQTRLLPISYALDIFPRIVRDLAKKQKKDIGLEIIGSEIELDRAILDEISDPLVHLVRNSIDHGIEDPTERVRLKKSPKGEIIIKVTRQRGQVCIEFSDDGRGIDFDAVGKIAFKKGIITEEERIKLDKESVF